MTISAPQQNTITKAPAAAGAFPVWETLKKIARMPFVWVGLLLAVALGYGYAMAVPAVDMDDLALANYQQGGEFLRQGRFTVWLLQETTGIMRYQRFWPELFFAVSLLLAGLVLAAVWYAAAGQAPTAAGVLLLGGGLLLWPYHGEILMYSNQCGVGFGFLLCAVALALAAPHIMGGWRSGLSGACGAAMLLCFALGLYESFAPVWLTMIFALLLVNALKREEPYTYKAKQFLPQLVRALWPLAAGLLLRGLVAEVLRAVQGITAGNGTAGTTIFWFRRESMKDSLVIPLREFLDNYGALFFAVPAITLLVLACVAVLVYTCRHKCDNGKTLFVLGLIASQFALGLLQGTGSQMARTTQCFAVFVPFVAWLLLGEYLPKKSRVAETKTQTKAQAKTMLCTALALCLLAVEGASLTGTLAFNRARWQYERDVLQTTATQLDALDPTGELPVAFTGKIELSDALQNRLVIPTTNPAYKVAWVVYATLGGSMGDLYRYENPQTLVINWAQTAFGSHEQMYLLMENIGRPCTPATPEQQAAADAMTETTVPGSVTAQDGYLLVTF